MGSGSVAAAVVAIKQVLHNASLLRQATMAEMSSRAHLSVLASGFTHLLASQIGTRIVTFGMNLLIARHLSPDAYGLSAVQFHLLITAILFLSREGFRRGCLRQASNRGSGMPSIVVEAF